MIAEDDTRRSTHIRYLVSKAAGPRSTTAMTPSIPRVIVQFWDSPGEVPADVVECLDSWSPLVGKGFHRIIFNDETARAFISSVMGPTHTAAFDRCRHPAMRCDYFRLCWMLDRGGFYVDADERYLGTDCDGLFRDTMLKVQPLCYDLSGKRMVAAADFLGNDRPSSAWLFYVNNNPLIAPPGHPVIRLALERSTRLLLRSDAPTDIQSITGPGNLTASLVKHSIELDETQEPDFDFIRSWDSISASEWPLSYRSDNRNWRLWSPTD